MKIFISYFLAVIGISICQFGLEITASNFRPNFNQYKVDMDGGDDETSRKQPDSQEISENAHPSVVNDSLSERWDSGADDLSQKMASVNLFTTSKPTLISGDPVQGIFTKAHVRGKTGERQETVSSGSGTGNKTEDKSVGRDQFSATRHIMSPPPIKSSRVRGDDELGNIRHDITGRHSTPDRFADLFATESTTTEPAEMIKEKSKQNIFELSHLSNTLAEYVTQAPADTTLDNDHKYTNISIQQSSPTFSQPPIFNNHTHQPTDMDNIKSYHVIEEEQLKTHDNPDNDNRNPISKIANLRQEFIYNPQNPSPVLPNLPKNETTFEDMKNISKEESDKQGSNKKIGQHRTVGTNGKEDVKPTDCPTCTKNGLTEDFVKNVRLNMFKDLLAKKMRVNFDVHPNEGYQSDRPAGDSTPKLPPWIVEESTRGNSEEIEKEQFYARDKQVIILGTNMHQDCTKNAYICFTLSLTDKIKQEVADAQLWFYKTNSTNSKYGLNFRLQELRQTSGGSLASLHVPSSRMPLRKDGWVGLNVTRASRKWVNMKADKLMLAIQCNNCKTSNNETILVDEEYKPLLVVTYVDRNQAVRNKRSENCNPSAECCRRDLNVVFQDMGMHEVLEPRNLSIGYCYGDCNELHQYPFNHTALTQRHVQTVGTANFVTVSEQLRPCCVPLILKDAFLMVMENDQLKTKVIPKVIVESCGCM